MNSEQQCKAAPFLSVRSFKSVEVRIGPDLLLTPSPLRKHERRDQVKAVCWIAFVAVNPHHQHADQARWSLDGLVYHDSGVILT